MAPGGWRGVLATRASVSVCQCACARCPGTAVLVSFINLTQLSQPKCAYDSLVSLVDSTF